MNILHVYRTYFPDTQGGLEETIRQICSAASVYGVTSTVLATSENPDPEEIQLPEAKVVRVKRHLEIASCSIAFGAGKTFAKLCEEADVVHYHFPWPFVDYLHLTNRPSKPAIVTYHSDIVRQRFLGALYKPVMSRFLKSVDRIICTSPNYFATSDVLSQFEEKVDVIPIGLDEQTYPKPTDKTVAETEQEFGKDFFLFVGVLRYYKGLHILLDAMKKAPYKVVIAGSGPTEMELKQHAKDLQLNNVIFAGHVSDEKKMALFQLCRGTVFPSYMRSEAFGVTLLEGAMSGKPLISTEVGSGTSHINTDSDTGFVVPPGSPKALRKAMDQLHDRPDMSALMGRKARDRYKRLFTGQVMAARYAEIYSELSGQALINVKQGNGPAKTLNSR
ncbi:MAG: glycosyltransferase [Pseudomonadaceae bacterium]|nr:glycosyltransferase [Pseudomonadaceae bacterium]